MTKIKLEDMTSQGFGRAVADLKDAGATFNQSSKTWELETVACPASFADSKSFGPDTLWYRDGSATRALSFVTRRHVVA